MEYYHYVNIFQTKGLEYILVICFLITLVFFVRNLERPPKWQRKELVESAGPTQGGGPVVVAARRDTAEAPSKPEQEGGLEPHNPPSS